jgi:hypothetical protein
MSPPIRRTTAVALALTASLALAPGAWAGDSRAFGLWEPGEAATSLLRGAWDWLNSLWTADGTLPPPGSGSGGDHRCTIDPNGNGTCTGSGGSGGGGGTIVPPPGGTP